MYFPELAKGRERERKIQKEHEIEGRQEAKANRNINENAVDQKGLVGKTVDIIQSIFGRKWRGLIGEQRQMYRSSFFS